MAEQLTNHQLAGHYVSLNNSWRQYVELGLFKEKLEFEYNDKRYRLGPFKLGIPEITKDPEGKEVVKTGIGLRYIDIISDYDLMFKVNKTIYDYLKQFIKYDGDHALPEYEDQ